MKKIIFTLLAIIYFAPIFSQENEVTTYYLIRHAEKIRTDKSNKNPKLTEKGLQRAENWSVIFKNVTFDYIYSTNYHRTKQTAKPTAKSKNLEILNYNPSKLFDTDFQQKTKGKTVLIVGHSNTTPKFANDILGKFKYNAIDDSNNANLYIITITNGIKNAILLKIPFEGSAN